MKRLFAKIILAVSVPVGFVTAQTAAKTSARENVRVKIYLKPGEIQ